MTNEELKRWHEDKSNFLNMEISINGPHISDVIVAKLDGTFYNFSTNKSGDEVSDVFQSDVRYIVIAEEDDKNLRGYYLLSDKEHDMLIIVDCKADMKLGDEPSFSWTETSRGYVSFNYGSYDSKPNIITRSYAIDICGQSFYHRDLSVEYDYCMPYLYPAGAKEELMDYIGGFHVKTDAYSPIVRTLDDDTYVWEAIDAMSDDYVPGKRTVGAVTCYDEGISLSVENIPLPDAVSKIFKKIKKLYMPTFINCAIDHEAFEESLPFVSIIQNINGEAVLRSFAINVQLMPNVEESKFSMCEYMRVSLEYAAKNRDDILRRLLNNFVVWMDDDFTGTVLERYGYMIKDAAAVINKHINEQEDWYGVEENAPYEFNERTDIYGSLRFIVNAVLDLDNNILERMFNLFYNDVEEERMNKFKRQIFHDCSIFPVEKRLENMFGRMDETKSKLEDIFMIPKGLLEYMIKTRYGATYTHTLKEPFEVSDEAMEYFRRLDNKSWQLLFDFILSGRHTIACYDCKKASKTLTKMIKIFGYHGWKNYINHMYRLRKDDWNTSISDAAFTVSGDGYEQYINMLSELPTEVAKEAQWKLSGAALKKSMETTMNMLSALKDEKFKAVFAENYAETSKWLFEDDKFKIVVPKCMEDVATEGLVLKHCAKEFIGKIANGETMLFFIRKKGEEDTPFFTLEIRDGEIRQCHGMCNQNVNEEGLDLEKFLMKFCKAKNISITLGTELLDIN